uniref:C-type lectin domain-containing protein n=1 Tax=Poecilia mexicana TaxID=48701 RepID=A0A3B3Z2X5_9TELE
MERVECFDENKLTKEPPQEHRESEHNKNRNPGKIDSRVTRGRDRIKLVTGFNRRNQQGVSAGEGFQYCEGESCTVKKKTWTEAQQYCREKHTDLVTVTNMTNMERLLSSMKKGKDGAWIGLFYQTDGTRTWYWSLPGVELNESEITWNEGEPNDNDTENCGEPSDSGGVENCGFMWKTLKWGDLSCNDQSQERID